MELQSRKVVVIDDDPTGSQTVHGCLLLTQWDVDTLHHALLDDSPLLFVLSNTRSHPPSEAARITREITSNLKTAIERCNDSGYSPSLIWVSRSDSTLRGHFPLETDVIEEIAGPFDHTLLIPAFIQGGRITLDGIHYMLDEQGNRIPVDETEFAMDSVFGFKHAFLPDYVEEKTSGRITSENVHLVTLNSIRDGIDILKDVASKLIAVDAEKQNDLDKVADSLWSSVEAAGKKILLRSGAGILASLVRLPIQPVPPEQFHTFRRDERPGVFLVGSHVSKTTRQIKALEECDCIRSVEIDVAKIPNAREALLETINAAIHSAFNSGKIPLIYTSRTELQFTNERKRLEFGLSVSAFLMEVVRALPTGITYLVSKGGITSNDVLSQALKLKTARLLGQIATGCSVVQCPTQHPLFPKLPVVIFPGNVGGDDGLLEVYRQFEPTDSLNV